MAGAVRVAVSATGVAVAVKRARAADAERLRHEAAVLRLVAGPGVAEILSLDELADGDVELATRYVGPATLADATASDATLPTPDDAAAVLAGVARTLAAVHAAGVCHGAVSAEHVLLGPGNAPVLCGWGAATGPVEGTPAAAAEDVRALGALVLALVPTAADPTARRLHAIAANATAADPAIRPPMIALAAALEAVRPPDTFGVERRRPRVARARRGAVVAAAAVALLAVITLVATAGLGPGPDGGRAGTVLAPGAAEPAAPPTAATTTTTTTTAPRTTAERVWPRAAPVVEHGGGRWVVGEPGDRAVELAWGCRAGTRLVVLRPSTGAVYVFDQWPAPGAAPAGRLVARVERASTVEAGDADGDGCAELVVGRDGGGPAVTVDPGP